MLASLLLVVIVLILIIYVLNTVTGGTLFQSLGLDLWPFNTPDPTTLPVGTGYIKGQIMFNSGNLQLWTFAILECGGQTQRKDVFEPSLIPDSYVFSLPTGVYTLTATLYNWPQGEVLDTKNYSSISVISQTATIRDINFGSG